MRVIRKYIINYGIQLINIHWFEHVIQEVLIIWGEHDQIFPVRMATELKE